MEKISTQNSENTKEIVDQINATSTKLIEQLRIELSQLAIVFNKDKFKESNNNEKN